MIIFIPGFVVNYFVKLVYFLSFPGTICHEIGHRFFCDIFGVPVYKVKYFIIFGDRQGYVVHGETKNILHQFFISMGPLILNTLLCGILTLPFILTSSFTVSNSLEHYIMNKIVLFFFWVGASCGIHAFPSDHDVECLLIQHYKNDNKTFLQNIAIKLSYYFVKFCNHFSLIAGILYTYCVGYFFYWVFEQCLL